MPCSEHYMNQSYTKKHDALLYPVGPPFQMPPKDEAQTCDKCGLVLKSLNNLRHHIKAIHDNLREFKCDHPGCDREFVGSSALKKLV